MRPTCSKCGIKPVETSRNKGRISYRTVCCTCRKPNNKGSHKPLMDKGLTCHYCGFIALHPCQIDVDHIDGNHTNNAKENLQALCANCHRLKTFLSRDGIYR